MFSSLLQEQLTLLEQLHWYWSSKLCQTDTKVHPFSYSPIRCHRHHAATTTLEPSHVDPPPEVLGRNCAEGQGGSCSLPRPGRCWN